MADKKIKNSIKIEDEKMLNENDLDKISGGNVIDLFEPEEDEFGKEKNTCDVTIRENINPANVRNKQVVTLDIIHR